MASSRSWADAVKLSVLWELRQVEFVSTSTEDKKGGEKNGRRRCTKYKGKEKVC